MLLIGLDDFGLHRGYIMKFYAYTLLDSLESNSSLEDHLVLRSQEYERIGMNGKILSSYI